MITRQSLGLAYLGLALSALFWAGNAVFARASVGLIPPFALSFWRWSLALLFLLPFALPHVRREWRLAAAHWRQLLWLALLSIGSYNTLLYLAAQSTTAVNITLVSATMPIAIVLMARVLLGQRLHAWQWAGILVALCGMAAIVLLGAPQAAMPAQLNPGDIIMVLAVLIWGLYSVLLRRKPLALHPLTILLSLIVLGLPAILPFYVWELATQGPFALTSATASIILYTAIFPSLLAYLFWNHGVAVVGPSQSGMFIYLVPVFTALVAGAALGEHVQAHHLIGGALILTGLYLSTRLPINRP